MTECKRLCKDCLFLKQEWLTGLNSKGAYTMNLDTYCGLCDIFKSPEGFCDLWSEK